MTTKSQPVPNLVLAQRVIDKMAAAAQHYVDDETGEAMLGLFMPGTNTNGVPTLYVLDTIAPEAGAPEATAVRERYAFEQGDESHYEIFTWLSYNWEVQREKRRLSSGSALQAKWDVELRHLGDWHKQPGFMIAPSGGDLMSALDQMADEENDFEFLLAPIVTVGHPTTTQAGPGVNYITVPQVDGTQMRVDFWYIHRDIRMFQPINPVIYPNDQLPNLPDYPWHLKNAARAELEFARLQQDKLAYSILIWDTDEKLPLEVCISAARMGGSKVFLIVTAWNYPEVPPLIRLAPPTGMKEDEDIYDWFGQQWEDSEVVEDPPGWRWMPDLNLVDYVRAVEAALDLNAPIKDEAQKVEVSSETASDPESPADGT
ncbi:MAG: hypothetical protein H7Y09_05990 [Chitinophagaceae bacterium]|nr:hypothetical protein [Anaerolineae bacterium]